MIPVDEVVFPEDISHGSSGGAEFKTSIVVLGDDREQRNQAWEYPRERWNVVYGVRTAAQLAVLRSFFHARQGKARGFLFKNHRDFLFYNEIIGIGDFSDHAFQLSKPYFDTEGTVAFRRKVTRPKVGTVVIKLDGAIVTSWSCNYTTGVITFSPAAPGVGAVVTASCSFYYPMRFDTDFLSSTLEDYLAESTEVPLIEVRP